EPKPEAHRAEHALQPQVLIGHQPAAAFRDEVGAPRAVAAVAQISSAVAVLVRLEALGALRVGTDQSPTGAMHVLPVVLIVDPAHTAFTLHADELLLRPRRRCSPTAAVPLARMVLTSLCHITSVQEVLTAEAEPVPTRSASSSLRPHATDAGPACAALRMNTRAVSHVASVLRCPRSVAAVREAEG